MIGSLKYTELGDDFFAKVETQKLDNSKLIHINQDLKTELNLDITDDELLGICSGAKKLGEITPLSTVYAGHQFGYFVPQLGDGRSCLIGEISNYEV